MEEFLGEIKTSDIQLFKEGDKITARISLRDHDDLEFCLENIKTYNEHQLKVFS